jgi:hypothetical protein
MTIKVQRHVDEYAMTVSEIRAALDNLREFVATLPAPNEDHEVPGVAGEQLSLLRRMHELLGDASEVADEWNG